MGVGAFENTSILRLIISFSSSSLCISVVTLLLLTFIIFLFPCLFSIVNCVSFGRFNVMVLLYYFRTVSGGILHGDCADMYPSVLRTDEDGGAFQAGNCGNVLNPHTHPERLEQGCGGILFQ